MGLPSLIRPVGSGTAAAGALVGELRDLVRTRERNARALWDAIAGLGQVDLLLSLTAIVESLPIVMDVDCASIRLFDNQALLHLVAANGLSPGETRTRALRPVDVGVLRGADTDIFARLGRMSGFRWVDVRWLGPSRGTPLGSLLLTSRTNRQPDPRQLLLLDDITAGLSEGLLLIEDRAAQAQACALQLARSTEQVASEDVYDDSVANLRPRERGILELYADGLSTSQIAALLVISTHTIRTHVKSALRTLGVHRREDAARIVKTSQLKLFF